MVQQAVSRIAMRLSHIRGQWLGWLLLMLATAFLAVAGSATWAQQEFLDPDEAFVMSAAMGTPTRVDVHFKVAPDYYMYQERLAAVIEPESHADRLGELRLPPAVVVYDPTFEQDMPVYYGQYTFEIPVAAGATEPLTLRVTSQGCADTGLCYIPTEHVFTLTPTDDGYQLSGDGVVASVPSFADSTPPADKLGDKLGSDPNLSDPNLSNILSLGDTGLASWLGEAGWWKIIGISFVFGLLLSFTPCVLPMVPILLAILAGTGQGKAGPSRRRGFTLAAVFVLGMSLVYTILGVAAGLVGASLAVWLQTPWVLTLFAVLLGLFALAMFDVYTFQAPTGLQNRLNAWLNRIPGGRVGGVFLMGMVSALIVGPCVAAPLAGVLLFISQTGDVALGGSALFAMAWGQGVLLLAVGLSSGLLMPRAGAWMQGVKTLFGMLLLATAWWMMMPVVASWVGMLGWAVLALMAAGFLAGVGRPRSESGRPLWRVLGLSLAVLLALWALALVVGVAAGSRSLSVPLSPFVVGTTTTSGSTGVQSAGGIVTSKPAFTQIQSRAELDNILANTARPVMLDFYADWCVSCIQMEKFTFSDPAVAARMAEFTLVQADVTTNDEEHRELLKRFDLFGPPGIIFFDSGGQRLSDARVVGFKDAAAFGAVLDQVLRP